MPVSAWQSTKPVLFKEILNRRYGKGSRRLKADDVGDVVGLGVDFSMMSLKSELRRRSAKDAGCIVSAQ